MLGEPVGGDDDGIIGGVFQLVIGVALDRPGLSNWIALLFVDRIRDG